eukprot:1265608-Rhodomonas_salina.1
MSVPGIVVYHTRCQYRVPPSARVGRSHYPRCQYRVARTIRCVSTASLAPYAIPVPGIAQHARRQLASYAMSVPSRQQHAAGSSPRGEYCPHHPLPLLSASSIPGLSPSSIPDLSPSSIPDLSPSSIARICSSIVRISRSSLAGISRSSIAGIISSIAFIRNSLASIMVAASCASVVAAQHQPSTACS